MPRSSETVGALASALAKAQATATIRTGRLGEGERSFRYAPLSSGLDIVRKTLGQHEIATLQTTAIDQTAGMVNLTTTLAHASGEWIASDWPVCPLAETANPQRMGAALTYARRYALFTLVGIAGEDDLDAPDICMPARADASITESSTGGLQLPQPTRGNGRIRGGAKPASPTVLLTDESAAVRDRFLSEISGLGSQDSADTWAGEALPAKNRLTAADAKLVEDAFERKLSQLSALPAEPASVEGSQGIDTGNTANQFPAKGIDKSVLAVSAPRRYRNKEHLRYVTLQPCLLCARKPSDAHHLRFVQPRALGRKASDEFAVPLCRIHHRAAHRAGDERAWWRAAGIDPLKIARKLWSDTRVNKGQGRTKLSLQAARTGRPSDSDEVDSKAP
jgi:hypothetical protein